MKTAQNYFTGSEYHGKNAVTLGFVCKTKGYEENQWATYKQWFENGYQVQKGEKGTGIQVVREDDDKKTVVKYYRVFNLAQVKEIIDEVPYCIGCDFINDTKKPCFNCGETKVELRKVEEDEQ